MSAAKNAKAALGAVPTMAWVVAGAALVAWYVIRKASGVVGGAVGKALDYAKSLEGAGREPFVLVGEDKLGTWRMTRTDGVYSVSVTARDVLSGDYVIQAARSLDDVRELARGVVVAVSGDGDSHVADVAGVKDDENVIVQFTTEPPWKPGWRQVLQWKNV